MENAEHDACSRAIDDGARVKTRTAATALAHLDDEELVAVARRHDSLAFETLMRRYNRRLFRVTRSILHDDAAAEDAVQECYVRAFTHLHKYRPGAFGAWLTRLAINEALMLRRRTHHRTLSLDDMQDDAREIQGLVASPDTTQIDAGRQLLEQAIDALPEHFRTVFVMRAIEQLSTAETAACLDINQATVKTRFHRAQLQLRNGIARRLRREHLTLFDFGGTQCDRMVATVLARLRHHSDETALHLLL